jgi:hypothetical protein
MVDIVLCIDSTASMRNIIERAKAGALKFHDDLMAAMQEKQKMIDELRIKVISFRDYYVDGDDSMRESKFFQLPQESESFTAFVKAIEAKGGGDEPENGLEALALAMKSDWVRTGDKRRHIIVIWTDASTHPLEKHADTKPSIYPASMAPDFDHLTDMWDGQSSNMDYSAKRLVIFAPDAYAWTDISNHWENVLQFQSKAGEGLEEIEYREIIDVVASSI